MVEERDRYTSMMSAAMEMKRHCYCVLIEGLGITTVDTLKMQVFPAQMV